MHKVFEMISQELNMKKININMKYKSFSPKGCSPYPAF